MSNSMVPNKQKENNCIFLMLSVPLLPNRIYHFFCTVAVNQNHEESTVNLTNKP